MLVCKTGSPPTEYKISDLVQKCCYYAGHGLSWRDSSVVNYQQHQRASRDPHSFRVTRKKAQNI